MQNNFIHKLHSKNAGMLCKQKQCNDCYILETHILLMLEHRNIVEQFLNINLLRTGEYLMNRLNKIVWKLRKSGEICAQGWKSLEMSGRRSFKMDRSELEKCSTVRWIEIWNYFCKT